MSQDSLPKNLSTEQAPLHMIYNGAVRLLAWSYNNRHGMTVDIGLAFPGAMGDHAFRGMKTGREFGQRLGVHISKMNDDENDKIVLVYKGEALLIKWSDNDRTGMMIRLELDDGPEGANGYHPFNGLTCGVQSGERMSLSAFAINEKEQVASPSHIRKRTPFYLLTEVKQANILCRDPRFKDFLERHLHTLIDANALDIFKNITHKEDDYVRGILRSHLRIPSLSALNGIEETGTEARRKWRHLLARYDNEVFQIQ